MLDFPIGQFLLYCAFVNQRCAGVLARGCCQSWRIRCPRPEPRTRTPAATRHACSSDCGGYAPPEITKTLGQVAPRNACAVAVEHRIDEQPVVASRSSGLPGLAGQQILDALPMRITQCVSSGHAPSHALFSFTFKSCGY